MRRDLSLLVIVGLGATTFPSVARAQDPGPPAIPVRELPPLPEVVREDAEESRVDVAGAQLAEEDVVIGAAKREQSLGTVASAVTVITRDQLERFGHRSVAEALDTIAGLYIVDDRMVSRLGIRGLQLLGDANTRILVLVDGTPMNEPWSQFVDTAHALPVHINDVARIEVIRGPVSSIYGTNAFFGIINIITVQADRAAPVHGGVELSSFGVVDGNAGFAAGGVNRQIRGTVSFRNRGGETLLYPGFEDLGEGPVDADGLLSMNASLAGHFEALFVQVRAARRNRELPGAPYGSVIGSDDNEQQDTLLVTEAGYNHDFSDDVSLAGRVYLNNYQFDNPLAYAEAPDFRAESSALWYGAELRGLVDVLDDNLLVLTAGAASEWTRTESHSFFNDIQDERSDQDTDFNIQGIYAEATSSVLDWLTFTVGARYDTHSIDTFQNNFSLRGAAFLNYQEDYGLKLLYAEGFRNPSIFEAFYDDGLRYKGTGEDLEPETIESFEVVLWGRPLLGLKVRLSAWRWLPRSLIEKESVRESAPPFDEFLSFQQTSDLRSQGLELESTYRTAEGWFAFLNATFADVVATDFDGNPLDDIPVENSPSVKGNVGVSTPRLWDTLHLSSDMSYISSVEARRSAETDAFFSWNAVVFVPDYRGFDFTLGARNILGDRREIPAQVDYDRGDSRVLIVPGEGRELFVRVGYRYQ